MAIFGIPSGMVVERLGARTTMLVCDARARAAAGVAADPARCRRCSSFPLLLALVFVLGCFMAPYFAAQRVILPELVGEDETTIAQANSVDRGRHRLRRRSPGRRSPGILIPFLGAPNVLYVDAATYAISFLLARRLRAAKTKRSPAERRPHGVLAGDPLPAARPSSSGRSSGTVIVLNFLAAGALGDAARTTPTTASAGDSEGRRPLLHGDRRGRAAREHRRGARRQALPAAASSPRSRSSR